MKSEKYVAYIDNEFLSIELKTSDRQIFENLVFTCIHYKIDDKIKKLNSKNSKE